MAQRSYISAQTPPLKLAVLVGGAALLATGRAYGCYKVALEPGYTLCAPSDLNPEYSSVQPSQPGLQSSFLFMFWLDIHSSSAVCSEMHKNRAE